jgi:hypothetical protein
MIVDIFITSFFRPEMTKKTIDLIRERTTPGNYQLHIFDNASDSNTKGYLFYLLDTGVLTSLHLDSRNTGCLYNKGVFHSMVESTSEFYCVTDNDQYPPKVSPDWLTQMVAIMEKYPDLGFLVPQSAPYQLMMPEEVLEDIVICKAVGNHLKLVRREAFPAGKYAQELYKYSDDSLVCELARKEGWKTAFCRNLFKFDAGQCLNWGYKQNEIDKDPRKVGYGAPFIIDVDENTYKPKDPKFIL